MLCHTDCVCHHHFLRYVDSTELVELVKSEGTPLGIQIESSRLVAWMTQKSPSCFCLVTAVMGCVVNKVNKDNLIS